MESLPELVADAGRFALPLSQSALRGLVAALVCEADAPDRQRLFAEVLAGDSALTLWTLVRASQCGQRDLTTVDALAAWLSPVATTELARPAAPADCLPQWAELTAQSLAVARTVETGLSAGAVSRANDRAYLLGLLHAAPRWLAAAASDGREPLANALPMWLQEDLQAIEQNPHSTSRVAAVVAALQLIGASTSQNGASHGIGLASRPASTAEQTPAAERAGEIAVAIPFAASGPDSIVTGVGDCLPGASSGVLSRLAGKLERLDTLERSFAETLERQKIDSLKELAYGAGHEINNPLANISARAQTLLRDERDPERRRLLAAINTQAFRAHEMIADMMLFARPPEPKFEATDVAALVRQMSDEMRAQAARQNTELVCDAPMVPVIAMVDKTQIAVAVRSLVTNALEALVTGGRVELSLKSTTPVENLQITVADNGPGISPEVRKHLFDPFFSGREAGRGLGFGLPKCWRIAELHGGKINATGTSYGLTVFTLSIPVSR